MRLLRFGCESVFLLFHFDNPQFYSDASSHNLVTFYWHLTSHRAHFILNNVLHSLYVRQYAGPCDLIFCKCEPVLCCTARINVQPAHFTHKVFVFF